MYPSIWEPSVKICSHLSWGYLVFIVSKARCMSVSVPVSPFTMLCCRCRQHSTGSMSTGFRRWGSGWGLLLISNFVFISVTFCTNPYCVFRFLGLFMYVFQYWSPGILSSFSCSSTAFSSINSCIGLLSVMKVIASMGVVFTAPVISLRAWFWACSSTLSVCGWAVTRGSQLYVIIGRMYFWYVMFKVDRAHPHLLPAKRFRTLMRLETREEVLCT